MQRNVELKKAWGGKHRGIEKVLKRNKLFNEEERQKGEDEEEKVFSIMARSDSQPPAQAAQPK